MANDSGTNDKNAVDSGGAKAEVFLELAKLSEQSIEKRKDIEWKVGFGFWTAIIVTTVFLTQNAESLSNYSLLGLGLGYLAALVVWSWLWQAPLHNAIMEDQKWKHYYAGRAEGLFSPPRPRQDNGNWSFQKSFLEPLSNSKAHPWFWGQVSMTAVFLSFSFIVICSAQKTSKVPPKASQDQLSVSGENVQFVLDKMSR